MSLYACKDTKRKEEIYASDAIKQNRDIRYYCPNPNCNAYLYICAIDGSKKAYFRATKSKYGHIKNCTYSSSEEFNPDKYDENQFIFDNVISNLFLKTHTQIKSKNSGSYSTGEADKHSIKTIKQIYTMCKSYSIDSKYGDTEIWKMILDERTIPRYTKGCFGYRLIEACVASKCYDNLKKHIYLKLPKHIKEYSFTLQFSDEELYKFICKEIYNNRDKMVVVAGEWKKTDIFDSFVSDINSKKQIVILK